MYNRLALLDSGTCVIQQQRVVHIKTERETFQLDNLLSPRVTVIPTSAETKVLSQHVSGGEMITAVTEKNDYYEGTMLTEDEENPLSLLLTSDRESVMIIPNQFRKREKTEHSNYCLEVRVSTSAPDTDQQFDLVYAVEDLFQWSAAYTVIVDERNDSFHFSGRYEVINMSDNTFEQVSLSLITEGHAPSLSSSPGSKKGKRRRNVSINRRRSGSYETAIVSKPFQEDTISFPVKRTVDIRPGANSVHLAHGLIQPINKHYLVSFLPPPGISHRIPNLDATANDPAREVSGNEVIEIQNVETNGLGLRLPAGHVQVIHANGQEDNYDIEEVVESSIANTEPLEFITVVLDPNRNLTGRRERTRVVRDDKKKSFTEDITMTIRNKSNTTVTTIVEDALYRWSNWKITQTTPDFHPNGTNKARWVVMLVPNATETITYTVQYVWEDTTL